MNSPRVASIEEREHPGSGQGLRFLAEIQAAHGELLTCIALMERVTAAAAPDPAQLTRARFRISQASLARRMLWRRIHSYLSQRVSAGDSLVLGELMRLDLKQFERSSDHVARWTAQSAISEWPDYRSASRKIRGHMSASIRDEQRLLYPLLHRYR